MMALEEKFEIQLDEEGAEKISTVQEAADMIAGVCLRPPAIGPRAVPTAPALAPGASLGLAAPAHPATWDGPTMRDMRRLGHDPHPHRRCSAPAGKIATK